MRKNLVVFLILFVSSIIFVVYAGDHVVNKVAAIVGKDTILNSDIEEIVKPIIEQYKKMDPNAFKNDGVKKLKQDILEQIIDEKLLLQEASRQKIIFSKRKQDVQFEEIKKRFSTEEEYKKELANQNMTEEKLKEKIGNQLTIMELLDKEVKSKLTPPSDEESKKYYIENQSKMIEPEAVRVRHILIKSDNSEKLNKEALVKIKNIKLELDKKADFAELAKKYSDDKITAEKGGDIGLFMRGQMVKEFEEVAFKLNVGEVSDIVKTPYGYHIIRCEEKRLEQKKTFEDVKDYIKQYLYQKKMDEGIKNFIEKLKKKTNVVINLK